MPGHDVAIYAPYASVFYDAAAPRSGGGAERQTWLLARGLARRGMRVAHIVHPVGEPVVEPGSHITLVQRAPAGGHGSARAFAAESAVAWRAFEEADAAVQVFRGATGAVGVGGLWARRRGRRLVFAGANNSDFGAGPFRTGRDPRALMFRAGMRTADAVVVQSQDQVDLARTRFPRLGEPELIPSFVEPAPETARPGEGFLWVSRLAHYKQPLLYADLAAAVPEATFWMITINSAEPDYDTTLAELRRRAEALTNLELLPQRPHAELQEIVDRAVAMVNTSSFEGMPNTWLEGWARGVPALTLSFDPDQRIARHGLGISGGGSWDAFVAGARRLWEGRADRAGLSPVVRAHVASAHGTHVEDRWAAVLERLAAV